MNELRSRFWTVYYRWWMSMPAKERQARSNTRAELWQRDVRIVAGEAVR